MSDLSISTTDLHQLLQEINVQIIDLRSPDAYNGWRLGGEMRGGHIPGARSLPLKWTSYIDWIEVVRNKGINPAQQIVLYSYTETDCLQAEKSFRKAGFHDISIYPHFISEWSERHDLPLEQLERFKHLVPPQWLKKVQAGEPVTEAPEGNLVVVHSHYRNREAYLSGHIPGAIDMDTLALEAPETWNRRPPGELKKALEQHGITSESTVVVYGKFMWPDNDDEFPGSAAGHIGAIRNALIMMYAGVKDVRILNGGIQSWKDAGYPIDVGDLPKTPVAEFGSEIPVRPELFVDVPEAKIMIQREDSDIVCVRSWPEYIGEVSGYNYIEKKGRIPGTVFADCGSDAYHMENYRNVDHTMREAAEVAQNWKSVGIVPEKHLAFYCGTGWRGSEAFMNAWLMGWPRVSVFDGGWFEWSNNPENPYETGVPEALST